MFTESKHSINQIVIVDITWLIKGYESYAFGSDKNLYNIKTGSKIKKCLKGYTKGYNLNGKFITLNKIRSLLYKPVKIHCPF